ENETVEEMYLLEKPLEERCIEPCELQRAVGLCLCNSRVEALLFG
ncbi:hypothetical protein A2U01_0083870, partial [Trifolium medium]|nr:hypothetical protein [Trifolium medium]